MRTSSLLPLLWIACAPPDPATVSARQYVVQLQPLLHENGRIADRLLGLSADVYNGGATSADVRQTWTEDLVPLTMHLRDQAAQVTPPEDWSSDHKLLIEIWSERADAYEGFAEAVVLGDGEMWRQARTRADDAKLREEAWFRKTNERLQPSGLSVDQYP